MKTPSPSKSMPRAQLPAPAASIPASLGLPAPLAILVGLTLLVGILIILPR